MSGRQGERSARRILALVEHFMRGCVRLEGDRSVSGTSLRTYFMLHGGNN
jgi:hypothetical protein